jgi:hypothetical protein
MKTLFNTLFSVLVITVFTYAQEDINVAPDSSSTFLGKNIKLTGEIGAYGELYSINGQPDRRPNSTGRIYFRPTLELFGLIQIPFEFLLSTEGSSARQNINQFGISPSWSWGTLHLGDFTEEYSQYTLSGVKIRGAGINIKPGIFRFNMSSGFTQRSVSGGAQDGTFKRFLFASKIGVGKEESSFVDFIFLRAKDEISSLDQTGKSINLISPNGNDVLEIGTLQSIKWNSYGVSGAIKIELSRDGGNSYEQIATNLPNVNYYNWSVAGAPTFQAMIKVSAVDDPSVYDVSNYYFTIGSGVQSIIVSNYEDILNPNSVTPQENLVVGTKGKVEFLENTLSLEFDGGGSVYTRDLRSTNLDLDSSDIPEFLTKLYKVKVGTNYDFAFNTFLNFNYKSVNTKVGYKRIGPGYNSLGTSYMINDVIEYSILNSFRVSTTGIMLGFIHQNDNVQDQKLFTTGRNIITAAITSMIVQNWNASISANYLDMSNNTKNDSLKTEFGSFVLSTNHSFILDQQGLIRNINLNYAFQNSDNQSYFQSNNKTAVHSLNFGVGLGVMENLSATVSAGLINSNSFDTLKSFTHNYALVIQHTILQNKLINSLNLSTAINEDNNTIRATLSSGYQLTFADNFALLISYLKFNGVTNRGGNFNEIIASLNYSHRF